MKKSKAILVAVLAVILCVMCATTTTFSWFTRGEQTGVSMKWSNTSAANAVAYNISNGNGITMQTFESADGETYGDTAVTAFGGTINASGRKYYRTDITNNSSGAQNVSLYLSNFNLQNNSGNGLYLGTNGPLKTYKSLSPPVSQSDAKTTKASSSTMRVYFQTNNVESWKDNSTVIKLRYGKGTVSSPNWINNSGEDMTLTSYTTRTLYFDIPKDATVCQIFANNDSNEANATPYMLIKNYCPNISQTQSYLFTLQAEIDSYKNHNCDTSKVTNGANIVNYNTILMSKSSGKCNAGLTEGTDYIGNSISYTSENPSVFTVDSSGNITPVGAGSAKLTTTAKGVYNDVYTVVTTVTVVADAQTDYTDTPIVTNYEITAGNTESVYWYIKNDGSTAITYTIDDVYLTL